MSKPIQVLNPPVHAVAPLSISVGGTAFNHFLLLGIGGGTVVSFMEPDATFGSVVYYTWGLTAIKPPPSPPLFVPWSASFRVDSIIFNSGVFVSAELFTNDHGESGVAEYDFETPGPNPVPPFGVSVTLAHSLNVGPTGFLVECTLSFDLTPSY